MHKKKGNFSNKQGLEMVQAIEGIERTLIIFSIYTLSDLGVLSNLIGSLSLANEH